MLIVQWPVTFVKLIVKKKKEGPYVVWIMLPMNLDATFIKLYVEENKLDYNTVENAPNVSLYSNIISHFFGITLTHLNINHCLPLEYILDEFRCLEEREQALKTSNESGIPIFVPVCKENGQYVDIQCHQGTGYCWCVNLDGKPVPRSSTKYKKPNCRKTGKLPLNITNGLEGNIIMWVGPQIHILIHKFQILENEIGVGRRR